MGMWQEFKAFAVQGNVVDMAVGIMIGAAFSGVVTSLVQDVVMPPLGLLTAGADFSDQFVAVAMGDPAGPYATLDAARTAGATVVAWGLLANQLISFLIVAMVLFLAVRWMNDLRSPDTPAAPETKPCPFCRSPIHLKAVRCPHCTSQLDEVAT